MERIEVELEDGPHGLEQARTLRNAGDRMDRTRRAGVVLWNVTLTLRILGPTSWWNQARQYFPDVLWLRKRPDELGDDRRLRQEDFEEPIPQRVLDHLNSLAHGDSRADLHAKLPESFLRSGVVHTNMETILTILRERGHYNSGHWYGFCRSVRGMESLAPLIAE